MPIHSFRPLTPAGRFTSLNKRKGLSKKRPERALTEPKPKTGGRNCYGRLTSRHIGGGHKQLYRIIDFKRADKLDVPAKVLALEYDPNRRRISRCSNTLTARNVTSLLPKAW